MRLKTLILEQYRNFLKKELRFEQRSLIIGPNGSGKTNIIEALRLLSVGKSFRTVNLDEVVSFNQDYMRIEAAVVGEEESKLEFFYGLPGEGSAAKKRQLKIDERVITTNDYWGFLPSVIFTPQDVGIVLDSPSTRRRYLDGVLWQGDSRFRKDLTDLGRALQERAALLFLVKINRADQRELEPWTTILKDKTAKIRRARMKLVDFLSGFLKRPVAVKFPKINLSYEFTDDRAIKVSEEIKLTQNLRGPHRDDLIISIEGRPARKFASRGQARTALTLLKAAEAEFLSSQLEREPVILLDDIASELDETNLGLLMDILGASGRQIIATAVSQGLYRGWQVVKLNGD